MRASPPLLLRAIVACAALAAGPALLGPALVEQARADEASRVELRQAFASAKAGTLAPEQSAALAGHPLAGWLQALALRQDLREADAGVVAARLQSLSRQPAGDWLREAWLGELARREDWPEFLRHYRGSEDAGLRCGELAARRALGRVDETWLGDARALWLSGKSLPGRCDAVFAELSGRGVLDAALRWQRFDLAVDEANAGLMRHIAQSLPAESRALAMGYAEFIEAPHARTANWPRDARSRQVISTGLARRARNDPAGTQARLAQLAPAFALDEAERGKVLAAIALWTVASYGEGSAERLAAVPAVAYDERLHEWRAREAMARGDDAAALAAIGLMPAKQREDSRWRYFEARLRERLGDRDAAHALYQQAAGSASFHGWLAADRLQQPYTLCALEPPADAGLRARLQAHAGLQRAFLLQDIGQHALALREWDAALKDMADGERRVAIALAQQQGWHDRGVFSIGGSPEDLRHYSLRFPLPYEDSLRRQSQINGLDPAWVAAQTRAESIFMAHVTSSANARGLMQVLPETGEAMARRLGKPWGGAHSLYEPHTNITLGTAYLRLMLDRYEGLPYLAIAAYNAGPAPVARWREGRAALEPDFWIETIPYKETRDYVARVMAFSVIYDWRLQGNARPLSERLLGRFAADAPRRAFACPTATPVASQGN
jgi:soluble lytic murein transglycosylase